MLLNFYGMRWLLILLVTITGTSLPIAHYPLVAVAESNKTTGQKAEADRLFQQGVSQYDNSQFQQALQSWQQAIKIYRTINDRSAEGETIRNLGRAYFMLNDAAKAIEQFHQSLAIAREVKNRKNEGRSLGNLGAAYDSLKNSDKAIEYYNQSIKIAQEVSDKQGEAISRENMGFLYQMQTNYRQAETYFKGGLALWRELKDSKRESSLLLEVGNFYASWAGYCSVAIDYYERSLPIFRELKNRGGEGAALGGMGNCYEKQGKPDKAIEYLTQSLAIAREVKNRRNEAISLTGLGKPYFKTLYGKFFQSPEDSRKILQYSTQGLLIARELKNRSLEAEALAIVGQAYRALENYQKAIETQKQRLTIAREFKDTWMESESLTELGISHSAIQENRQAISYHQQSIVLYHQRHKEFLRKYPPKDPSNVSRPYGIGEALMHLGDAYNHNGDYEKAIATYQESLGSKSPTGGGSTFDNILNTRLGNTFANLGKFSEAELALKSAIGFEDMFRQAITDKSTDINRIDYAERLAENYRLLQQVLVRQNRTNDALEIAEESRARVFVEQLASRVSGLPLLKDTALSQPPKLAAMRQIVTDQNATLVQYSLADKDLLYIWVMKPNGAIAFKTVNLKDKLRPINDLITHSRQAIGVRAAIKISSTSGVSREDSTLRDLRDLYKILIEPIAAELPNDPNQRVIFIPQGELFLVPFPALKNVQGKYLIEQHTISSAPSIQTLNLTRKQRTVLPRANTIPLIVGNPIMPRLKGETLLPLPGAEKEALTIAQLFNTTALIGGEATKSTVLNRMKSASIIHLATHGLLNIENTGKDEIPGAIALAPSPKVISENESTI